MWPEISPHQDWFRCQLCLWAIKWHDTRLHSAASPIPPHAPLLSSWVLQGVSESFRTFRTRSLPLQQPHLHSSLLPSHTMVLVTWHSQATLPTTPFTTSSLRNPNLFMPLSFVPISCLAKPKLFSKVCECHIHSSRCILLRITQNPMPVIPPAPFLPVYLQTSLAPLRLNTSGSLPRPFQPSWWNGHSFLCVCIINVYKLYSNTSSGPFCLFVLFLLNSPPC